MDTETQYEVYYREKGRECNRKWFTTNGYAMALAEKYDILEARPSTEKIFIYEVKRKLIKEISI